MVKKILEIFLVTITGIALVGCGAGQKETDIVATATPTVTEKSVSTATITKKDPINIFESKDNYDKYYAKKYDSTILSFEGTVIDDGTYGIEKDNYLYGVEHNGTVSGLCTIAMQYKELKKGDKVKGYGITLNNDSPLGYPVIHVIKIDKE